MHNTTEASPDKIFKLEKLENPDTLTAVHVREKCCEDPNISNGAARLFCRLLDFALNPYVNLGRKGQVIVSQMKLSSLLNCAERSIRYRADELIKFGYIWISKVPRPNTHPITCYHITAFEARRETRLEMSGDGLWGNCKRRFDSGDGAVKARQVANCRKGSLLVDALGRPVSSISYGFALPAAKTDPCEGSAVAAASGNGRPLPAATACPSDRQRQTPASSNGRPLPAATADPSPRTQVADLGESQPEVESPLESESLKKRSSLNALKLATGGKVTAENLFLEEVEAMMEFWRPGSSAHELENSGKWWRLGFRSCPKIMQQVLADVQNAVKEGRIRTTPGKFAVDYWKQLGGPAIFEAWKAQKQEVTA